MVFRQFKIACVQINPQPSFESAIKEAQELMAKAVLEKAEFIFLPEYCGGLKSQSSRFVPPKEIEEKHLFLKYCRDFALKNDVWLLIGSIAIAGLGNKYYNRGYVINNGGDLVSRYDKINLFDVELADGGVYQESSTVIPGGKGVLVDTGFVKLGHTICYDLRFPTLYRCLAKEGAEILAIPSAFTKFTGEAHWHVLNRARAIENTCYVIAPCSVGMIEGGGEAYGHSLIVDPWGTIIADGGTERGIITASIDLDQVIDVRSRIPSLTNDRNFDFISMCESSVA